MAVSMKFSKEFLASYRVVRALGQGGMGLVVEAEHLRLRRRAAVKFLRPECFDTATRERFAREARILAKLSHPNIVQVYDASLEGEQPYLALEYVDGPTLEALVQQKGVLKPLDAIRLTKPLLDGLGYLHSEGVLHRDLKMANVLVAGGKVPKLADFGLAWLEGGSRLTASGLAVGTPMYMAPEQLLGQPAGPQADLYAVGMMLGRMLTGANLIRAESPAGLLAVKTTMTAEDVAARLPGVPAALTAAIARCLAPDPAARPGSAEELSQLLQEAGQSPSGRHPRVVAGPLAPQTVTAPAAPVRGEGVAAAARRLWPVALGGLAVLGVAGLIGSRARAPAPEAFTPREIEVRALPGAARVSWKTGEPCPSRLSRGTRVVGTEEATREHLVEVSPVAWGAPGEARLLLPDGTVAASIALKAEPVPLSPTVERHGHEVWLKLALPESMPLTVTFTRPRGEEVRVVRLPERKIFREAIPLEAEQGELRATLSLPPGRVVPERLGPFALPVPERVLVSLVKALGTLSLNAQVREVSIDATLNQGSPRAAEKRFEALLGSIRWRERFDEVAQAAAWVLRPANPHLAFKAELLRWLERVQMLDAAARTLGLRFETGADRLLGKHWECSIGVPKGRILADVRFDPPCELLGSLVSKLAQNAFPKAADRREVEFDLPDLTRASRAYVTLFLTGARPDVGVDLKLAPGPSSVLRLQCLYLGRDRPDGQTAITHGIDPSFLRAGRHRLELSLSTVVGFAAFHLTVHRVQLRAE